MQILHNTYYFYDFHMILKALSFDMVLKCQEFSKKLKCYTFKSFCIVLTTVGHLVIEKPIFLHKRSENHLHRVRFYSGLCIFYKKEIFEDIIFWH